MTSPPKPECALGKRWSRPRAFWLLAAVLALPGGRPAHAACNLIPGTTKTFGGSLGALNRPFAAPGEQLEIRLRPCDAASPGFSAVAGENAVTIVFTPAAGPRNAVVLQESCGAFAALRAACEAQLGGGTATCVGATTPSDLEVILRNGDRRLSIRFPDSDSRLGGADDERTLAGPARIGVTRRGAALPCGLASAPCAAQTGLVACVDTLFADDGSCGTIPNSTFGHFTALPPPNDYQSDCFSESPPCSAGATELRATVDAAGNALLPMNWTGILVRAADVPVPRLLRGTISVPIPFTVPSRAFLGSFTPEGGVLPPIFEPQNDPAVPSTRLTLFGSADAPYTVLRIARRNGICAGGDNDGLPCTTTADCPAGSCPLTCVGGGNDDQVCTNNSQCPGGQCGALFNFAGLAVAGVGPIVLPRIGAGICQGNQGLSCAVSGDCGVDGPCVTYAVEAQSPVPLEGLAGTNDLFAFALSEAIDARDANGDGDATDSVVTLRDRVTGVTQPIGASPACGIAGTPPGRAVARLDDPPFTFPAVASEDDVLAFLEPEPAANACDANGDDEIFDTILRVFRLGPTEVTAGLDRAADAAPLVGGRSLAVSDGLVFFRSPEPAQAQQIFSRISVGPGGVQADGGSFGPAVSGDGRFIAFRSFATNLVAGDTNGVDDVFVYDRVADTMERVNLGPGGVEADFGGVPYPDLLADVGPSITPDGRFVTFTSGATNLVAAPTGGFQSVFVRDRLLGTTEWVDVPNGGGPANSVSYDSAISADGRFVVFTSLASNMVVGDTNGFFDVFVRDRQLGVTSRVSISSAGVQADDDSGIPDFRRGIDISADGRWIVFSSCASTLAPGDGNGFGRCSGNRSRDIFVRDRVMGTTEFVSAPGYGQDADDPTISADGRFVAYFGPRVAVHDRFTGVTSILADGAPCCSGPSLSPDGRFLAFASAFEPGESNGGSDAFLVDRTTGLRVRLSVDTAGIEGDQESTVPVVARDGRVVAFASYATNLVAADTNGVSDIFVHGVNPADCASDLTGDCDLADTLLQVVDGRLSPPVPVTSVAPAGAVAVAAGNAAFLRPEAATASDLNGDSDDDDSIVHLWRNRQVGAAENLACPATAVWLSPTWLAALVDEAAEGASGTILNGDGDASDTVLAVHRVSDPPGACTAPTWTNVGQAVDVAEVAGSLVAFLTPEAAQGATSLNPGADADVSDRVLQLYYADGPVPQLVSTAQAAAEFVLEEAVATPCGTTQLVAFRTSEASQGGVPLNGDGDADDDVLQVFDAAARVLVFSGQAVTPCRLEACDPRRPYRLFGSKVKFLTFEPDQGAQDLNGDGDSADLVIQVFDACTGALTTVEALDPESGSGGDPLAEPEPESQIFQNPGGRCDAGLACEPSGDPCAEGAFCAPDTCDTSLFTCVGDPTVPCGVGTDCPPRCVLAAPPSCVVDADCPVGATCRAHPVVVAVDTTTDTDDDGVPDTLDNSPETANPTQEDADGDGVGDASDAQTLQCGNGIVELPEECEAADDGACPGQCRTDCTCACPMLVDDPQANIRLIARNDRGKLSAKLVVPLATYNDEPVSVRLDDGDSLIARDVVGVLPPQGTSGNTWQYRSKGALRKAQLRDLGPQAPGSVRVTVHARKWFLAGDADDTAANTTLTISVGTQCFAHAVTTKVDD